MAVGRDNTPPHTSYVPPAAGTQLSGCARRSAIARPAGGRPGRDPRRAGRPVTAPSALGRLASTRLTLRLSRLRGCAGGPARLGGGAS